MVFLRREPGLSGLTEATARWTAKFLMRAACDLRQSRPLGGVEITVCGEQEVNRLAVLVDGPIVAPPPQTLMYVPSTRADPQCGLRNWRRQRSTADV